MKKLIILVLLSALCLIALAACESDIVTYKESGTIVLTITNEDLEASDVTVISTDGEDDIVKSGNTITITKSNMLRTVFTLGASGYVSKTVIVSSTDFDLEKYYEAEVEFEDNYVYMTLEVITEADYDKIKLTGSDIISATDTRGIFDIKVKAEEGAEFTVSAGTSYRSQKIVLTEADVVSGSVYKIAMLIPKTKSLIEIALPPTMNVNCDIADVISYNKNGKYFYGVDKDREITFTYYDVSNYSYNYYGEKTVTVEELASDYIYLNSQNLQRQISLNVTPYLHYNLTNGNTMIVVEVDGEDFNIINYQKTYGNLWMQEVFNLDGEYRIYCLGGDGNVRYCDIDVSLAEVDSYQYRLDIEFDTTMPVVGINAEIVDVFGYYSDFSGVSVYGGSSYETQSLGTIASGNDIMLMPSNYYSELYLENLPADYYSYEPEKNQEYYEKLMLEGLCTIYVAPKIDLNIHFSNPVSLAGNYISCYNPNYIQYDIDSNNDVLIEDFCFDVDYYTTVGIYNLTQVIASALHIITYEDGIYSISFAIGYINNG